VLIRHSEPRTEQHPSVTPFSYPLLPSFGDPCVVAPGISPYVRHRPDHKVRPDHSSLYFAPRPIFHPSIEEDFRPAFSLGSQVRWILRQAPPVYRVSPDQKKTVGSSLVPEVRCCCLVPRSRPDSSIV